LKDGTWTGKVTKGLIQKKIQPHFIVTGLRFFEIIF